jgi:hypothetical protein
MLEASDMPFVEVMKAIGIPGILEGGSSAPSISSLELARINKIGLLYSIKTDAIDIDLLKRSELLNYTVKTVSSIFNRAGINYSIFKTIKPFPSTPADVDVLISDNDFDRAVSTLVDYGYRKLSGDTRTVSLKKDMIVDLQVEPSVSTLPYLSRRLLMQHTEVNILDGIEVRTLAPEAEIIAVACHAIYKELMFTINDYYTIIVLTQHSDIGKIIEIMDLSKTSDAMKIIIGLCAQITESIFTSDLKISQLSSVLGSTQFMIREMPVKFTFGKIVKLILNRASKDVELRHNLFPAMIRIASPKQLLRLISHLHKSTY